MQQLYSDPTPFQWLPALAQFFTLAGAVLLAVLVLGLLVLLPRRGRMGIAASLVLIVLPIVLLFAFEFLLPSARATSAAAAAAPPHPLMNHGVRAAAAVGAGVLAAVILCPLGALQFLRGAFAGLDDLLRVSPRRVYALTGLTIREALRKRTFLVFVVFGLLFMFAGWFMNPDNPRPEIIYKNYVNFVITSISWIILPAVFLLSCWSLPDDIKARSIHTVVTKPARRSEVFLGRLLGISVAGSLALLLMAALAYAWLIRSLPSTVLAGPFAHYDTDRDDRLGPDEVPGSLTLDFGSHDADGDGYLNADEYKKAVAGLRLTVRVPVYGKLGYKGERKNVGDIFDFRGFIAGNSPDRGVYTFSNVKKPADPDEPLRIQTTFQAFRTHKGNIEQGIVGQLAVVNPSKNITAFLPTNFAVREFRENVHLVPRTLHDAKQQPVDLWNDLIDNGTLTIEVACLSGGQYLGMAMPDMVIRLPDKPFIESYVKSIAAIWLMMLLIITVGVTASCSVKGPVATLVCLALVMVGLITGSVLKELNKEDYVGGGPLEATFRLVTHLNPMVPLPDTLPMRIIQQIDLAPRLLLRVVHNLAPDFEMYSMSKFTAAGYDVPWDSGLLPAIAATLAYLIPCLLIGQFSLRLRELESK